MDRTLALGLLVVSLLLLAQLGPAAWRSWRIYSGTGQRRQEDATADPVEPSASVRDRSSALAAMGYRTIGKTKLALPTRLVYAWILAADDARSYAIVVDTLIGTTGIYTAWPDGTWLGTMHPRGAAMDRAGLLLRAVGTTLEEAVRVQREGVDRLRATHGEPRPVRTMPDMLALDADYRMRFGGSELKSITLRNMLPAALAALVGLLALGILFVQR